MIIEGLVTTLDEDGQVHLAPMGPVFPDHFTGVFTTDSDEILLKPFPSSQSYQNLVRHPYGVFHITDNAQMIAYSAVGKLKGQLPVFPAETIRGYCLHDCCRAFEFRVKQNDNSGMRAVMQLEVLKSHHVREFIGFNRARHAVIEAAILATRFHLIPAGEIDQEFAKLLKIVDKTGGPAECDTMAMLRECWREYPK